MSTDMSRSESGGMRHGARLHSLNAQASRNSKFAGVQPPTEYYVLRQVSEKCGERYSKTHLNEGANIKLL